MLQQLDYLAYIDIYHERIKAFHVKDAEFNPTGRQGVYSGYAPWVERAGRFRSLGDGQVDFGGIFSKLAQYGYSSWAVLEWECCLKHPEDGAREGAEFIKHHIIRVTEKAFDDFAGGVGRQEADQARARTEVTGGARWLSKDAATQKRRAHPARHGGRRGGRLHRRGPPHRLAHRRPVRARRRRAVVDAGEGAPLGRSARPRRRPHLRRLREHGEGRGQAPGRDRGGLDRHAQPHARRAGDRLPRGGHPRHLRQAADGFACRSQKDEGRGREVGQRSSPSPTTTPAIRWCGACARWFRAATSA